MTPRRSRLALLLVALSAPALVAQGVSSQAAGTVLSRDAAAIVDAKVTIRNAETGLIRTVRTDSKGRYFASLLPVGPYSITVEKDGFQTASNIRVNLSVADSGLSNIRMAPVSSSTVEVVGNATPPVDKERAAAGVYVSPDSLANLPVLNRSFTSLALLTPQVVVADRGNLAIAGQRGVNTSINIDGGDNNEPFFGGALGAAEGKTPFTISIEAIREYQVVTDGASAEFGRMGGGYVNAVTKNGTNDFSGSLFYYARPRIWVEPGPTFTQPNGSVATNPVGDFKQEQFGFSVGGPIIKDKLFYFVAYDAQRRTDPVNFAWGGTTPVVLNAGTNPNDAALISRGGNYTPKANSDALFARFDWNLATDHLIQFRVNTSNFKGDAYTGISSAYENSIEDDIKTLSLVGQWNWTIGSSWMNELRMNYSKDEMPRTARATIPQVSVSNVGYYGRNPYPRDYETKRLQFSDSLSYVTTSYQIKGGVDYNRISVSEIFSSLSEGGYTFNDSGSGASLVTALNNYRAGGWTKYSQRFSLNPSLSGWEAGAFDATEAQMAAYIQADFRPVETLKVGLGVRWDRQTHPDFAIADVSNPLGTSMPLTSQIPSDSQISPRLSFVWTPAFDRDKTVIRGSIGRYVSPTPSVFLYQAYTVNGVRMAQVDFTAANAAAAGIPIGAGFTADNPYRLPGLPTAGASLPKSDIFTFAQNFRNPTTDRINLGVEHAFDTGLVLGLSGAYARGKNLERLADINLGAPVASASGRLVFPAARPNTNFAKIAVYTSDAESLYQAITASAKYQKEGSPFLFQAFYTYAHNKDNDSNERNFSAYTTQNTQRLGDEWGPADTDRRQTLTGQMTFLDAYSGVQLGLALRYLTGSPYSMTYSGDINKDSINGNDRVYVGGLDSGRNSMRTCSLTTLDLKLSREFALAAKAKIQGSFEVFNLFNRQDTYSQTYITGSDVVPVFNQRSAWIGSARQIQIGARLSF